MNVGTIPSPNVINDHNPAYGPPTPTPPPPVAEPRDGKSVNEILSETIQRLRRDLIESNVKNEKLEEKNQKVTEEKERLRVLVHQQKQRIDRLTSQATSVAQKKEIVREMLADTKFTPVKHSIFTSNVP